MRPQAGHSKACRGSLNVAIRSATEYDGCGTNLHHTLRVAYGGKQTFDNPSVTTEASPGRIVVPTCDKCGGEIEFRYVGGRPVPIHIGGGWCSGYRNSPSTPTTRPFRSVVSYVNPNAHCPVCSKIVFYYQSPNGGRVFFDALGWPWPKHSCTDNPASQSGRVIMRAESSHQSFRNKDGEALDIYELDRVSAGKEGYIELRFRKPTENRSFTAAAAKNYLRERGITIDDIRSAPSFVVRTYDTHRLIEFISGRRKQIVSFRVERARKV